MAISMATNAVETTDVYLYISIAGYMLAVVCLMISVYLYMKLRIPQVIRRLRTIPSKQKAVIKERNKVDRQKEHLQNAEQLGLFDFESTTGNLNRKASPPITNQGQPVIRNSIQHRDVTYTTVLNQQASNGPGTVVLNARAPSQQQTDVRNMAVQQDGFYVKKNIVFINTSEMI